MANRVSEPPDAFLVREALGSLALTQPNLPAITTAQDKLSFSELYDRVKDRAGAIAAISKRLGNATVLPVFVDHSVNAVIDCFACLWVRLPFAPIDSTTPAGRVEDFLQLLNNPSVSIHPGEVPREKQPPVSPSSDAPDDVVPLAFQPGDTGAVFMTSGSTGTPKGVAIPWSTIDYRLHNYFLSLDPHNLPMRVASLAPLNFVAGFLQISLVLHGAEVFRANPRDFTPMGLLEAIADNSPTHLFLPSQLFRLLSRISDTSGLTFPECRLMSVGGESVWAEDLHRFASQLPEGTLFRHVLGATESMTFLDYTDAIDRLPATGQIPIGSDPIPDTTRLVSQGDNLFEVWCSGPIATGYLSESTMAQERFVFDDAGRMWWKSGDLVSWTDEHTLIHRGRVDDTVKVQGKLASPSEVVFQLEKMPEVRGAVVTVESDGGNQFFVAHVDTGADPLVSVSDLREHLREVLDSHLVPRRIVLWESFPLNPHGKVDRQALTSAMTGTSARLRETKNV